MLRHHLNERRGDYNEIIVDTRRWEYNMPDTVMAIFWLDGAGYSHG